MKGIVNFYMNVEHCEKGQEEKDYIDLMINTNSSMMARIEENGFGVMVVPVRKESSRMEKVDFDRPFPRYILPHVDIIEHDKIIEEIKDKSIKALQEDDE